MEKHIQLPDSHKTFAPNSDIDAHAWFSKAIDFTNEFYSHEIARASSVKFDALEPDTFFSEYTWVVHATGFSAKAVTKFMSRLSSAYGTYNQLAKDDGDRIKNVLGVCNNIMKAKAVKQMAVVLDKGIQESGWEKWKSDHLDDVNKLQKLPFIGPVTKFHLGRNIGMLDYIKPDLHLVRLAEHWGYSGAEEMIKDMNKNYSYKLGIADMIAWYYASTFGTIFAKKENAR